MKTKLIAPQVKSWKGDPLAQFDNWFEQLDLREKHLLNDYVVYKINRSLQQQKKELVNQIRKWTKGRNVTKDNLRHFLNQL